MAISDYDIKIEKQTVEATGPIESVSRRIVLTVGDPGEIAGTTSFASTVSVMLYNAKTGKIEKIPDLKLQVFVNNTAVGGGGDFSEGKFDDNVSLELGRNRVTMQIVDYGLHVTATITITKKVIGQQSVLPIETDSYVTGLSTIRTQVTPEKANVKITYAPDDSNVVYEAITDPSGMAFCDKITIKRPTWFTIVAPTVGIEQTPERLCIVPPPVGVPSWAKKTFLWSSLAFSITLGLLILTLFVSSGSTPEVVQLPSDPVERMWATAQDNYKEYDTPNAPVQKPNTIVPVIRGMLAKGLVYAFLATLFSGIACIFKACAAVWRNWKYRNMEDRTGTLPQANAAPLSPPQVGQQPVQTVQSSEITKKIWQTAYEIIKEVIAEMSVDVAARKIKAFKMPRITL